MPSRNDYMYEAWRSMFQAAGAPPPAIPGMGAFNNPYAFSIPGAGAAMGLPPGLMQGETAQQMQMLLPLALRMITGDDSLAQRLTRNNRVTFGNISRAQQSQEILSGLNETAQGATAQNVAGAMQTLGLGSLLDKFGVSTNDAADFLMQAAPFIDPRLVNMINRFDPGGGSLGLGTALYQTALTGTNNTRINENTAALLGEQFQRAFTQQQQFAGGEYSLLDVRSTTGLNLPQMGVLAQQARARGLIGDVLAGSAGASLLDRIAGDASAANRPVIEDLAAQVRAGDLTAATAIGRLQDQGIVTAEQVQATRRGAIQENIERETPQLQRLSRSVAQAGSIFESLQDNIPALLEQLENMTGNLQNVNESEVKRALASFQSLVELSGTSAELLSQQAQIISSRVGVSWERGARLATDVNLTSRRLEETGLNTRDARSLADSDITFLSNQALQTRNVQTLAAAGRFATEAGRERIRQAVAKNDTAFLANPLQALIDAGQITDVEGARATQASINAGNLASAEDTERSLSAMGLEAGDVVVSQIRARALANARASGADLGRIGRDIRRRFNRSAEAAGIEGRLGELTEAETLELAAVSARVANNQISAEEAAALVSARFDVGTLDPMQAFNFFRPVGDMYGSRLSDEEQAALGLGMTLEISKEQRQATAREQERIKQRALKQLSDPQYNKGLAGFLNLIKDKEDIGIGGIIEAALISGGVLIDEERFAKFAEGDLTDEERERIARLKTQIVNAENPEEADRYRRELKQYAAELGGELGLTIDQTMTTGKRRTRQNVREQLGIKRVPVLSDQARIESEKLAGIDRGLEAAQKQMKAAQDKEEAAREKGDMSVAYDAQGEYARAKERVEKLQKERGESKARLQELVDEDRRTAEKAREGNEKANEKAKEAEKKDDEESSIWGWIREVGTAGIGVDDRYEWEKREERASKRGSGVEQEVKLSGEVVVRDGAMGELVADVVDARISSGSLADKTEQTGGR